MDRKMKIGKFIPTGGAFVGFFPAPTKTSGNFAFALFHNRSYSQKSPQHEYSFSISLTKIAQYN